MSVTWIESRDSLILCVFVGIGIIGFVILARIFFCLLPCIEFFAWMFVDCFNWVRVSIGALSVLL